MPTIYSKSFPKSGLQKYCCSHECIKQTNLLRWVAHHSFTYWENYCSNLCVLQFPFHTYLWSPLCSNTQKATMHTCLTQQLPRYCMECHYFNRTSKNFLKVTAVHVFQLCLASLTNVLKKRARMRRNGKGYLCYRNCKCWVQAGQGNKFFLKISTPCILAVTSFYSN